MVEQDAEPESPVRSQRETVTCLPEVTSPGWRDGRGGITPENPSSTQKCHPPILLVEEGFLSPDWYEKKKEVNGSGKVTHNHRPTRDWAVIAPPETGRSLYRREARSRPVTCHSEPGLPHARRPGPTKPRSLVSVAQPARLCTEIATAFFTVLVKTLTDPVSSD